MSDVPADRFESDVLDFLWENYAKRLSDLAQGLGMNVAERVPYQFGAQVIERLLDSGPASMSVMDLTARGVSAKTVRMPKGGRPYESMSFPAFRHEELAGEEWPSSSLRAALRRLLVVGIYGQTRETPLTRCTLGHAFFWSPNDSEWSAIKQDWEGYRDRIRAGRAENLPTEAETRAVHIRPHGRDSRDLDVSPGGGTVTRKSFWLNRAFVEELFNRYSDV